DRPHNFCHRHSAIGHGQGVDRRRPPPPLGAIAMNETLRRERLALSPPNLPLIGGGVYPWHTKPPTNTMGPSPYQGEARRGYRQTQWPDKKQKTNAERAS